MHAHALSTLLCPAVLCFALGMLACRAKSDLRLPEAVQTGLSAYLMLAIGLRGGAELDQIGAALRHASRDTTAIYAKVDIDMLGAVAQPWPGYAA